MRNPPFCDSNAVSRYGITFNINIERSKDLKEVENFFYRYFKVLLFIFSNATTEKISPFVRMLIIRSSLLTLQNTI